MADEVGSPGRSLEPGEGFYHPRKVNLPFDLDPVLRSLVRIPVLHQYAAVTVLESERDAERLVPEQGAKTFFPEGVVLWHLALTQAALSQIREDAGLRLRPLLYEAARAFEGVDDFPCQRIVPLQTAALGFFVSPAGHFLTNYHVVGEEIEAAGRTEGSADPLTCRYTAFELPLVDDGDISGWRPLSPVRLLRNPSRQDWKEGFDAALLQAALQPRASLQLADGPPRPAEDVWVFGLPVRSARPAERRRACGYEDADGTLRVSRGRVVEIQGNHNFITDADSFNGYSGGPVLRADGVVVGLNWNVYPHGEVDRRAVRFEGGSIHVTASAVARRLLGGSESLRHYPGGR